MLKVSLNIENAPQEREADLAAAMIAEEIRSLTDDPREMIELVNQYLVDNVEYPRTVDYDDETLWNAYGALIQGKAVCEGYCYENKLLAGIGKGLYGSGKPASKLDYSAVLLRAAGIYEGYTYQTSDVEAVKQGLLSKTRAAFSDLSRGDVVSMTYNFLSM